MLPQPTKHGLHEHRITTKRSVLFQKRRKLSPFPQVCCLCKKERLQRILIRLSGTSECNNASHRCIVLAFIHVFLFLHIDSRQAPYNLKKHDIISQNNTRTSKIYLTCTEAVKMMETDLEL